MSQHEQTSESLFEYSLEELLEAKGYATYEEFTMAKQKQGCSYTELTDAEFDACFERS
jgi:hypothetical protein